MHTFTIDPDIARAKTLDTAFYTDPLLFGLTKEKLFAPSWQFIGDSGLAAVAGEVMPLTLLEGFLDEPLVLVRDAQAKLRLLSNVCTHRGNIVVDKPCRLAHLRCRYHGRIFDPDGRFRSMPEFREVADFPSAADDLVSLPLERWGPWLFTSLAAWGTASCASDGTASGASGGTASGASGGTASGRSSGGAASGAAGGFSAGAAGGFSAGAAGGFRDYLGDMIQRLHWLPLDRYVLRPELNRDFTVKAHWALYCENYLEGFHIPFVHAGLNSVIDFGNYSTELFRYSSLQLGIAKDDEAVFDLPVSSSDHGKNVAAYYFFVFPNLMFNFYPWGLSVNIVKPVSLTETRISFLTYVADELRYNKGAGSGLDTVELEDEEVVEAVQRGVRSRFYTHGRYSVTRERGTHHFHRLIAELV